MQKTRTIDEEGFNPVAPTARLTRRRSMNVCGENVRRIPNIGKDAALGAAVRVGVGTC